MHLADEVGVGAHDLLFIRVFQLATVERAARSFGTLIELQEQAGSMFYSAGFAHN
jgi:hypothetical protein